MHFLYSAFGLTFRSALSFPNLPRANSSAVPDAVVSFGTTPVSLPDSSHGILFEGNSNDIVIRIHDVANYWVDRHNNVTIEKLCDDEASVRLFFLTNVMAALTYRMKRIPLHASAVVHNNGLVLFLGNCGAGKSTTAAKLAQRGHTFFSDDVCVLYPDDDELLVGPTYPIVKLWADSLHHTGLSANNNEPERLRPEIDKYGIPLADDRSSGLKPVRKIFFLEQAANGRFGIATPVGPREAFLPLLKNVYRRRFGAAMGSDELCFRTVSKLAANVPTFTLSRPVSFKDMDAFMDRLEEAINAS